MERHKVFRSDRIKVTERLVREYIKNSVLEIGAGDYSFDYLRVGDTPLWIKTDFSQPCDVVCDFNKENLALPFGNSLFSLVICTEVIEHLLWPQSLLVEILRVLSNDGHIVLSVPNCCSLTYRLAWVLGRIPSCAASGNLPPQLTGTVYKMQDGSVIGGHVADYNIKRTCDLLRIVGFTKIRVYGSGIIWHRQLLPYWMVPASLSSNAIIIAGK